MSPKELKTLLLLSYNPTGLYGSELVALSDGYLKRGTVYTTLERLIDKGYVTEKEELPTTAYRLARTRHFISGEGQITLANYLKTMNLQQIQESGAAQYA